MDWISVEDELPDEGQRVDIWARYNDHVQWQKKSILDTDVKGWGINKDKLKGWREVNVKYDTFHDGDILCHRFKKNSHKDFIVENNEVTHWMPLPEPPE